MRQINIKQALDFKSTTNRVWMSTTNKTGLDSKSTTTKVWFVPGYTIRRGNGTNLASMTQELSKELIKEMSKEMSKQRENGGFTV